jgi:hypothetical protein
MDGNFWSWIIGRGVFRGSARLELPCYFGAGDALKGTQDRSRPIGFSGGIEVY